MPECIRRSWTVGISLLISGAVIGGANKLIDRFQAFAHHVDCLADYSAGFLAMATRAANGVAIYQNCALRYHLDHIAASMPPLLRLSRQRFHELAVRNQITMPGCGYSAFLVIVISPAFARANGDLML